MAVDATGVLIAGSAKWTTHSDGVDDLLSVTLQAGTGPSSPTAITSGAAMPSANSYYYHNDHQGSVRAITDQTGTITNAYAYDSYGTAEESVESLAQRFRYTGREFDALTGLYHYRARAYDPQTGRFLQEDPLWFDAGDLNIYRMTWNNPVNWTDPSGMSGTEYGGVAGAMTRAAPGVAMVGNALSCTFNTIAGIFNSLNAAQENGFYAVENIATYTTSAAGIITSCAVTLKASKYVCKVGEAIEKIEFFVGIGYAAANVHFLMQHANSFDGDTKVLVRQGYVAIKDIKVGDEVAAIDEKSGTKVWRKVTEIFSKPSNNKVDLELQDVEGKRTRINTTLEHPFHVENWDGKVETMLADLGGHTRMDGSRLFPSEGRTPHGEWVKAGALKKGDQISTRNSAALAEGLGPRFVADENHPLTVTDIIRDNRPARVYNFEVESRPGEITHNYFVGDDQVWVHNASGWRGKLGGAVIWTMQLLGLGNPLTPDTPGFEDIQCDVKPKIPNPQKPSIGGSGSPPWPPLLPGGTSGTGTGSLGPRW